MKKSQKTILKRVVAFGLAILMFVSVGTEQMVAYAGTGENVSADMQAMGDMTVESTNSFGALLSNALTETQEEQLENNGCNIFSIDVEDTIATVDFETVEDATLLVALYEDNGVKMLGFGSTSVEAGQTSAEVTIEMDEMPQYFLVRGFLVNAETEKPMSVAYENPMYTQEMQEFLSMTTEDFDEDRVLNLDDDNTNNFAVYSEETQIVEHDADSNILTSSNDETQTYVFDSADESITNLQSGDIFVYEQNDGTILIVKIADISINGTTVTITGEDTSMEEVFEYVKIDTEMSTADAEVDDSTCAEGVEYLGKTDDTEEVSRTRAIEGEGSTGVELSYKIKEYKIGTVGKIDGSIKFSLSAKLKYYVSTKEIYVEFKIDYSAALTGKISAKTPEGGCPIPLCQVSLGPVPCVTIKFVPFIVFEAKAEVEISGKLSGTIGVKVSSKNGITNLTKNPEFSTTVKVEGTVFVGFYLEPKVIIISEKIVMLEIEAKVGAEVKASIDIIDTASKDALPDKKHTCDSCLEGEISGIKTLKFEAQLANLEKWKFSYTLYKKKIKITDFYYSFDEQKFGWGKCPNVVYKVLFQVNNEQGKPLSNIDVNGKYYTDNNGQVILYLQNGIHHVVVSNVDTDDYRHCVKVVKIDGKAMKVVFILKELDEEADEDIDDDINTDTDINLEVQKKSLSLGSYHSAGITEDGSLYTWGQNTYGQLGDGTKNDSAMPIKIMDDVVSVSLGSYHSAAITKDGSLYTWGRNFWYQLGDGTRNDSTVPIKIMDDVVSVSLGSYHSAAITKDGSLYTWGDNDDGQLGDGTKIYSSVPIKIMEDVVCISLGDSHNAVITKDGSLYTWGDNSEGQLGDGTKNDSAIPIKIMDNVVSVSLGVCHSAAITEDGSLYMWGDGYDGQLGDGTRNDSTIPIKIMESVVSVSLGAYHSAAITDLGNLYTWGNNINEQLGRGTDDDSAIPFKIMDNVNSVSLGVWHSAAITNDGSLYTWGANDKGQLGDGTRNNSSKPIKIMDISSTIACSITSLLPQVDMNLFSNNIEKNVMYSHNVKESTLSSSKIIPTITQSDENEAWSIAEADDLVSNDYYNFYVVKSTDADNLFSADNLLYVGQSQADEDGNWSLTYRMSEEYDNPVYILRGMSRTDISSVSASVSNLTYTGESQFAQVALTYDGVALVEGVDYELMDAYSATDVGTYTVTVQGIGEYTGEVSLTYKVIPVNMKNYTTMSLSTMSFTYNGQVQKPTISVKDSSGTVLKNGTDYTISYIGDCKNVGTYMITVTGKGNYSGTLTQKYSIGALSLASAKVTLSKNSYDYDGSIKKPTVTVTLNGTTLVNGTDYTISYKNNTNVGIATVSINGKGNYTGTKFVSFTIDAFSLASAKVTLSKTSYDYDGSVKTPIATVVLNGKTLVNGTDYTISYKNNKNIGTATVTITGKGNYTGSTTTTFTIKAKKSKTFNYGKYKYKVTGSSTVAFAGVKSKSTTTVMIPKTVKYGGKTFKVTSIVSKALYKNIKVKKVSIGANVTSIGKSAFEGCTKLSTLSIGSKVATIGEKAFKKCTALTKITIPSKVKSIGKEAFYGCKKLANITIKTTKLTTKNVKTNAFKGIKSKVTLKAPSKILKAYKTLLKKRGVSSKAKFKKA